MQTCTNCGSNSPDEDPTCANCGADLLEKSEAAVALKSLRENSRVGKIRLMPHEDCCPACRTAEGIYEKDNVPILPVAGCSNSMGCRCFYEPFLLEMYP